VPWAPLGRCRPQQAQHRQRPTQTRCAGAWLGTIPAAGCGERKGTRPAREACSERGARGAHRALDKSAPAGALAGSGRRAGQCGARATAARAALRVQVPYPNPIMSPDQCGARVGLGSAAWGTHRVQEGVELAELVQQPRAQHGARQQRVRDHHRLRARARAPHPLYLESVHRWPPEAVVAPVAAQLTRMLGSRGTKFYW
jgi:hypothetical protein